MKNLQYSLELLLALRGLELAASGEVFDRAGYWARIGQTTQRPGSS